MAYDMLYGLKSAALHYMEAVLESANARCREIFHRLHDDCLRAQWRVWQLLHERREYRIHEADRREVEDVRQRLIDLCRTHGVAASAAGGMHEPEPAMVGGGQGGRWEESGRWAGETRYGGSAGTGHWQDGGRWEARRSGDAAERGWAEPRGYGEAGSEERPGEGGVRFEPGPNLPPETRFAPERSFAGEGGGFGAEDRRSDAGRPGEPFRAGGTSFGHAGAAGGFGGTGTQRYGSAGSGTWQNRPALAPTPGASAAAPPARR
jgi:hypothetical protein